MRVAENLLADIPGLDEAGFCIGTVAPDSGIPDERHEHFTPRSSITHFHAPSGARYPIADLAFFRRHLRPALKGGSGPRETSFLLGYYFHLLADNLWLQQIDGRTRARFQSQFDADPEFIWEVKRDWYGLDLAYVREDRACLYWRVFLGVEYAEDYLPFLPTHAIAGRVQEIKDLYQRTDDEIEAWYGNRPGVYLGRAEYEEFVVGNRPRFLAAYSLLMREEPCPEAHASALELVP